MKNFLKSLLIISILSITLSASGCAGSYQLSDGNTYQCVGIADKDEMDPKVKYKMSIWNTVLSIFFAEMLFPPIIWLVTDFYCPVAIKQ